MTESSFRRLLLRFALVPLLALCAFVALLGLQISQIARIGASKIARDISDRKRVERLLIQSEKLAATGRMAATIAHEINNPLESLMNLVFLARQNSSEGGEAHGYLLLRRVNWIAFPILLDRR